MYKSSITMMTYTTFFKSLLLLAVMTFASGLALNVYADETGAQISVAGNGQTMVRGASVTGISGSTIYATTVWGSMRMSWAITTNGSTRFVPDVGSSVVLRSIKVGDSISFSGTLDGSSATARVVASVVKDISLIQESVILGGTVMGIDTKSGRLFLSTQEGTTTVATNGGTIITLGGNSTRLSNISVGDTVKAFGTLNSASHLLSADKITVARGEREFTTVTETGIFAGILKWLRGSNGLLTTRS